MEMAADMHGDDRKELENAIQIWQNLLVNYYNGNISRVRRLPDGGMFRKHPKAAVILFECSKKALQIDRTSGGSSSGGSGGSSSSSSSSDDVFRYGYTRLYFVGHCTYHGLHKYMYPQGESSRCRGKTCQTFNEGHTGGVKVRESKCMQRVGLFVLKQATNFFGFFFLFFFKCE